MEAIIQYFESIGFSAHQSGSVAACFKQINLNKGDYFVKEGKKSSQIGFLESGQLQYFSITDSGEERTTYFSLPNSFVASLLAYLTDAPARENIRAVNPVSIWVIEKKDVLVLLEEMKAFKDFYIKLIEWQICCIDKAKFDLITLTAEQR